MGHVVIRRKRNVVGDEPQYVVSSRCIQNMNPVHPYNTCYTGGESHPLFIVYNSCCVVKLEVGAGLEPLIPRSPAAVSPYGDTTFPGAVKPA
ncbi:Tumor necrosis factor ligand superfamily member 13B [Liparis tanakae]|uniref:Tumor necrosis factor ligand superfamily member 13B n=1 Tax=Liparis tanakae TaxID=230148 RepID=A0A4Z2HCI2_9TELE|nr:Tumor necrosis factor ligand superfamily member 13B [Liparis tanakae]